MRMLALTKARASKVETQHRKSKMIQRLHRVKNYLVVQSPTKHRMRMTHHRRMSRVGRSPVEQRFQSARGTVDEERSNGGSFSIHWWSLVVNRESCIASIADLPASD